MDASAREAVLARTIERRMEYCIKWSAAYALPIDSNSTSCASGKCGLLVNQPTGRRTSPPPPPRTRAAELERDRRNGERVPGGVLARPTMVKRSGGDAGVMPGDGAGA